MSTVHAFLLLHQKTLMALEDVLESTPEEAWSSASEPGAWRVAEVFDHIGRIAEGYSFLHLETCLAKRGQPGSKGLMGRLLLFLGSIPGGLRIRAPFPPELLPKVISKAEARSMLARLLVRAEELALRLEDADPSQRARHFRLGWLNALEWYQFAEMHHRHHLEGQLRRLQNCTR